MLLIAFYGKFCNFYKLFMPKLLSQSKHEEFEPNSALQIRDQKERRAENAKKLELQEIWQGGKFSQPTISQAALFSLRNFHPVALFMPHAHCSLLTHYLKFCLFVPLFDFFPFYPCNS